MAQHQDQNETQPEHALLKGAFSGFAATLPMTIFMLATQRFLPKRQQYELPPEMITKDLAKKAHIRHHLNKQLILGATMASHFGYGAAAGAAYGPLQKRIPLPSMAQGVLYGLLVWAASYLGLLPLIGVSASGDKEPVRRNLMMIAAHVVWGASLGAMAGILSRERG